MHSRRDINQSIPSLITSKADEIMLRFKRRIAREPNQVLRYQVVSNQPHIMSEHHSCDRADCRCGLDLSAVTPLCPHVHAAPRHASSSSRSCHSCLPCCMLECDVIAGKSTHLQTEAMERFAALDFGVLAVYTCTDRSDASNTHHLVDVWRSCNIGESYVPEWIVVNAV